MSDPSTSPRGMFEERPRNVRITARLIWGIAFLCLGALWTLDNLGLVDASEITRWWPALVLTFGIAKLAGWGTRQSTFSGAMWLLAGAWLMLHAIGIVAP